MTNEKTVLVLIVFHFLYINKLRTYNEYQRNNEPNKNR